MAAGDVAVLKTGGSSGVRWAIVEANRAAWDRAPPGKQNGSNRKRTREVLAGAIAKSSRSSSSSELRGES